MRARYSLELVHGDTLGLIQADSITGAACEVFDVVFHGLFVRGEAIDTIQQLDYDAGGAVCVDVDLLIVGHWAKVTVVGK